MDMSRKAFLCSVGVVAGMFAIGGVGYATEGGTTLLRPPGGQDEERFIGSCLKCDRCRSICPKDCLTIATLEDGLENARTPRMDFRKGYCIFCDKCIDVCPTAALTSFDKDGEKIGLAVIDEDICIAFQKGSCRKCVDVCEYDAIELSDDGKPAVRTDRCNGCGRCEYACPTDTYRSYKGNAERGINVVPFDSVADEAASLGSSGGAGTVQGVAS